jgi:hypothetical protein
MAGKNLLRLKPGAPVHVHLLVAALIWTIVGLFLMMNGYLLVSMAARQWFAVIGIGLGTIKSFFILDRMTRKNIQRILDRNDNACIGSVYSLRTWGLVIVMIVLGRYLRSSVVPGEYVGVLYLAVGWGLLLSSRLMWLARIRFRR